jgi:hypothetical protein
MLASVFFWGQFFASCQPENMISKARKKFGEKMNIIHHISIYKRILKFIYFHAWPIAKIG